MKFFHFLLFIPLITISCATPLPISKLTPYQNEITFWNNGREVFAQSKDSISIEVSFYEKRYNLFIFDIVIANERNKSITVDPNQFFYLPISTKGDTLNPVFATNPESKILQQQMKLSKLDADRKNAQTELLIFGSLEIASELSDPKNSEESENSPSSFELYDREIANINYMELTSIDEKVYWENQVIRKTTLFPDHYLSGQILLRYKKDIKKVGLIYSTNDVKFEFWFEHSEIPCRSF